MSELFAVFGVNWKLLIIQAFNFGALLAILTYFLYKPLFRIISERQEKVAEGVRAAEEADQKLKDADGKSKHIIGEASREAEGLVATARAHAQERGDGIIKAAEERAAASLKDAQMKAAEARRSALEESKKEIARAAMLAAEKILREKNA